jgi:hypothetical protein
MSEEEGAQILPTEQPVEEETGIELGSTLLLLGGRYNKTRGKLYSIRPDKFSILPIGVSDRLIHIPLVDGIPDPELGIVEIKILKKAPAPGFISMVDMRAGQYIETFDSEGNEAGIFKVIQVNESVDTAEFETLEGEERFEIEFGFTGIPVEYSSRFEIIRTRESPVPVQEGQENQEKEKLIGVEEDDIVNEGVAPASAEEDAVGIQFEVGEILELPVEEEIQIIDSSNRIYPDVFQRSEMLADLIRMLPEGQQRNIAKLQSVRRFVELMMILRNEVVEYGVTNEPKGMKETVKQTIAELFQNPDVTMTRKIAMMNKVLYFDKRTSSGKEDPPVGPIEEGLYGNYLEDILQEADVLEQKAKAEAGGETIGMPQFYQHQELYRQKIQQPYKSEGTPLTKDEEVFRMEIPDDENPDVNILPRLLPFTASKKDKKEYIFTNPPPIVKAPFATAKLLTGREGVRGLPVEGSEGITYTNLLVFPKHTRKTIGGIRSGNLARDIGYSIQQIEYLDDMIKRIGINPEYPTAEGLLALGVNGNTLGNISIEDWLRSQSIKVQGFGDVYEELDGFGFKTIEFTKVQAQILQEKIEEQLAGLRGFINTQREENETLLKNLRFEPNNTLEAEQATRLLARIESEPLLQKILEEVRETMGDLSTVDSIWFTYVFLKNPDLTLAVLGRQPGIVARERLRYIRDQYIQSLQEAYRLRYELKNRGYPPNLNTCKHVEELELIYKIKEARSDEPQSNAYMKAMIQFLRKYRGKTKDDWVWCNVCKKHLICGHELLMIQEYQRPKEQEVLHKEMIIKFSGGAFGGKFICKVCGQKMSELEFDTHLEFDDEGRPMMGRSMLVDEDAQRQEEIDLALSGAPIKREETVNFGSDELNTMYATFKKMTSIMGINPEEKDYKKMIDQLKGYTNSLPKEKIYYAAAAQKKIKAQEYSIWYSVRYVSAAAAILLLNVQTHIPDYIIYYTNADCRDGFMGYPLEGEERQGGMMCMAAIIAGINDRVFPWSDTTLQSTGDFGKRKDAIFPLIKTRIEEFKKQPIHQASLKKKKEYRLKVYGYIGEEQKDQLLGRFKPQLYKLTKEEAAETSIVAEGATAEKRAEAWIRQVHGLAAETVGTTAIGMAETTCCLGNISKPQEFWKEQKGLPAIEVKEGIHIPFRSGTLATTFEVEKKPIVKGNIEPGEYYKLFSKFCYKGDRKGLFHELGIGLTCYHCGINFKRNPHLPYETINKDDKKTISEIEKFIQEDKMHIESQGIEITDETFQELLTTIHLKAKVKDDPLPEIPDIRKTFESLLRLERHPVESFGTIIEALAATLTEINANTATDIQIVTAAEELFQKIQEAEGSIEKKVGKDILSYLRNLTKKTPRECGEAIMTYIVVPFQRWYTKLSSESFRILDTFEFSAQVKEDILGRGMAPHIQSIGMGEKLTGGLRAKVRDFIKEMSLYCKDVFPLLRSFIIPGGNIILEYILLAYIMGPIERLLNSVYMPELEEEDGEGKQDMKLLYKAFGQALTKFVRGSRVPSEEEIQIALERRAEAERLKFATKQDKMTKEEKQADLMNKRLGLGDYAVGGSRAIREHSDERYAAEALEMEQIGYERYRTADTQDMFGIAWERSQEGEGYDVDQMREDDY